MCNFLRCFFIKYMTLIPITSTSPTTTKMIIILNINNLLLCLHFLDLLLVGRFLRSFFRLNSEHSEYRRSALCISLWRYIWRTYCIGIIPFSPSLSCDLTISCRSDFWFFSSNFWVCSYHFHFSHGYENDRRLHSVIQIINF